MICFLYELFQRKVNHCTTGPNCHKKKKKKNWKSPNVVLESLQTLFGPCHDHELSKHCSSSPSSTEKNIIDLLEEIKKDLYMLHIIQIQ